MEKSFSLSSSKVIALILLYLKQIRFHQLTKNFLVFVPLLAGHLFLQTQVVEQFFIGFLAFCFIASCGYIVNDILDLQYDRLHPHKSQRPLAKNELSINAALILLILFFITGSTLTILLKSSYFQIVLFSYFIWTFLYSVYFKKLMLIDVFSLALFYTLRIVAGMVLIPLHGFSAWLVTFSFFFFLSLGFIKRYAELHRITLNNQSSVAGRNYLSSDLQSIGLFGIVSAFISILVLMLYINSENTSILYHTPQLLWLISLILLFWILRMWMLALRGEYIEDPIAFALKDKVSVITLILISAAYILASI